MQAGSLVASDVQAYASRVLVNGIQRDVGSWNVDRELSGDLPAQVVAVSGVTQATGNISWASDKDLTEDGVNPWNRASGWIPARGDRVEIFVSDGVTEWKQFHGVIDKTTGSVGEGFQSTIIDDWDRTSRTVSHRAMLRVMPPLAWDGSEPYRSVGLHPIYYVDYALRHASFYTTPAREAQCSMHAPLQGSLWPHWGLLRSGDSGFNTVTPWGLGKHSFTATYSPSVTATMAEPTQLSMLVAPDHAGAVDFMCDYGTTDKQLRLSVTAQRIAVAFRDGVEVCRLTLGAATIISLLVKDQTMELRSSLGLSASGSMLAPSMSNMSAIRVNASSGASVGGLQVSHPQPGPQEHQSARFVPSAVLDTTSLYLTGVMDAGPNIEGRQVSELLDEINRATLSAMWIDETGVMRWAASDTLRERTPARTVTTLDDVLAMGWEDGLLGTASKVTVKGIRPGISRGRWRNMVIARGDGESMKSGDELEVFLEPGSDEDWIMPAFDTIEVGGSGNVWGPANNPAYSLVGLYYTADGGTTTVSGLSCTITTQELGYQKLLVKYVAGDWPSDVEGILATSPTNEILWPRNRNQNLPRLVGRGKIQWSAQEVSATGAGGPGPELVHDAGPWACRADSTEMLDRYASYLQSQTSTPKPTISDLGVVPDPRLQLGDVITIDSPSLMGVTMTALVVGVSSSFGASYEQSLTVRIIGVTTTYTTYAEYDQMISGNLSYAQWQALGPVPQSYAEFNNE